MMKFSWQNASSGAKIIVLASCAAFLSTFIPWLSIPMSPSEMTFSQNAWQQNTYLFLLLFVYPFVCVLSDRLINHAGGIVLGVLCSPFVYLTSLGISFFKGFPGPAGDSSVSEISIWDIISDIPIIISELPDIDMGGIFQLISDLYKFTGMGFFLFFFSSLALIVGIALYQPMQNMVTPYMEQKRRLFEDYCNDLINFEQFNERRATIEKLNSQNAPTGRTGSSSQSILANITKKAIMVTLITVMVLTVGGIGFFVYNMFAQGTQESQRTHSDSNANQFSMSKIQGVVIANNVIIHSGPGKQYERINAANTSDVVTIISIEFSDMEYAWVKVQYGETIGWMYSPYIQTEESVKSLMDSTNNRVVISVNDVAELISAGISMYTGPGTQYDKINMANITDDIFIIGFEVGRNTENLYIWAKMQSENSIVWINMSDIQLSASDSAEASNIIINLRKLKSAALRVYADALDTDINPKFPTNTNLIDYLKRYLDNVPDSSYFCIIDNNGRWWVGLNLAEAGANDRVKNKLAASAESIGLCGAPSIDVRYVDQDVVLMIAR